MERWTFKRLLAALLQGGPEYASAVVKASGWEWGTVYAWLDPSLCPSWLQEARAAWHRDNFVLNAWRPSILIDGRF